MTDKNDIFAGTWIEKNGTNKIEIQRSITDNDKCILITSDNKQLSLDELSNYVQCSDTEKIGGVVPIEKVKKDESILNKPFTEKIPVNEFFNETPKKQEQQVSFGNIDFTGMFNLGIKFKNPKSKQKVELVAETFGLTNEQLIKIITEKLISDKALQASLTDLLK